MSYFAITQNSGREISLEELFQYRTYGGLIEGKPNIKMNERLIKLSLEYAKKYLMFSSNPILLPPPQSYIELGYYEVGSSRALYDSERKTLPGIVCLSTWNSYSPARDENKMCSVLSIVWFQSKFAFPIDTLILEQLKILEWDKLAEDYDI